MTTPGATEAVTPDYERGFREAQRLAAQIADERCKSDYAQWKDDVNWQQPFACNRVVRASMSIAESIRSLLPKEEGQSPDAPR